MHTPSGLWLWFAPGVLAIGASVLQATHVLSLTAAGVVWTAATLWIGIGCAVNARHCDRLHCRIDSVAFPLLALGGLLNVVGVLTVNWNAYWAAFFVILIASFVPELCWKKFV